MPIRKLAVGGLIIAWGATQVPSAEAQLFGRRKSTRSQPTPSTTPISNDSNTTVLGPDGVEVLVPDGYNAEHERIKNQADAAYQKGQYQVVVDLTSKVISEANTDHVAYYLRASALVELGLRRQDSDLIRRGIGDARQAVRLDEQKTFMYYLPYLYGMTNLAKVENRPSHAKVTVQIADQVLKASDIADEDKAHIYYQRANALYFTKDYEGALTDFRTAVKLHPAHLGAQVSIAEALNASGQMKEAEAAYSDSVEAFPNNSLVYNNRGMFYQRQKQSGKALADFEKAIEIDENFFHAITNKGYILLDSGRAAEAEAEFSKSLRINPQQPLVYSLRGTSRLEQGKAEEAIKDYRHVLTLDPQNAVAMSDLGFAKFFSGDYEGAVGNFDEAIKINDSMGFLNPWRYQALVLAGKQDEANRRFHPILERAPEDNWVTHLMTYLMGRIDADMLLEKAAESESEAVARKCEAEFFIGSKLDRAGETTAAASHYRKSLETKMRNLSAYRGAQYGVRVFGAEREL